MSSSSTQQPPRAIEILLFVPNLIGYARVLLLCLAFNYMTTHYRTTVLLYALSAFLDAVDGYAARILNQCSKFGAVLDMLTDRVATASLIICLAHFYPKYMIVFQLWVMLDICSHWAHQLASVIRGDQSHKNTNDKKRHFILRLYYTSRAFLFFMCAMTEVFFCSLYLMYFTEGPQIIPGSSIGLYRIFCYLSAPVAAVKTIISGIHLLDAAWSLACVESEDLLKKK
jgi:CDP-diacylglycerol--inositol 3-phosphatidyltransferase